MRTYTLNTDTILTLSLTVYDEILGLVYDIDVQVGSIPISGSDQFTPANYMDPPESCGEVTVDMGGDEIMGLIENGTGGGLVFVETPEQILQLATDAASEWAFSDDCDYWN